jgi:hypothetical protein
MIRGQDKKDSPSNRTLGHLTQASKPCEWKHKDSNSDILFLFLCVDVDLSYLTSITRDCLSDF